MQQRHQAPGTLIASRSQMQSTTTTSVHASDYLSPRVSMQFRVSGCRVVSLIMTCKHGSGNRVEYSIMMSRHGTVCLLQRVSMQLPDFDSNQECSITIS